MITRSAKGSELTHLELDNNLLELEQLLRPENRIGLDGPDGSDGCLGCTVSIYPPINPDLNPDSKVWVQIDPDNNKIIQIYKYDINHWALFIKDNIQKTVTSLFSLLFINNQLWASSFSGICQISLETLDIIETKGSQWGVVLSEVINSPILKHGYSGIWLNNSSRGSGMHEIINCSNNDGSYLLLGTGQLRGTVFINDYIWGIKDNEVVVLNSGTYQQKSFPIENFNTLLHIHNNHVYAVGYNIIKFDPNTGIKLWETTNEYIYFPEWNLSTQVTYIASSHFCTIDDNKYYAIKDDNYYIYLIIFSDLDGSFIMAKRYDKDRLNYTGYTGPIRIYNNLIYIADFYNIKVINKNDYTIVQTIPIPNSIRDFIIINNVLIYIYDDQIGSIIL